jgi:hypothetical protein
MTDKATHVQLAVRLLRDAAGFFRNVADQNPAVANQMRENADVYEEVAALLDGDPDGTVSLEDADASD